ncbi:hypothetical protein [Roseiflexus sp.]
MRCHSVGHHRFRPARLSAIPCPVHR